MLLRLTQYTSKNSTRIPRIIFGAFIASLLVPITLYMPNFFLTTWGGKIIYSVVIIICTFRIKSFKQFRQLLFLFYFLSFSLGGGLLGFHYILNHPISIEQNGVLTFHSGYGNPVTWIFLSISFPIIWIFTKRQMDEHTFEQIKYDQYYQVEIQIANTKYLTNGYVDSGNHLFDPLTKRPVIICDEPFLKQWFTEQDWLKVKTAYQQLTLEKLPEDWRHNIHVIPYYGVEGKNSLLFALKPDKITIYERNKKIITKNVLIGIQFSTLTEDHDYHCLLQPQVFQSVKTEA